MKETLVMTSYFCTRKQALIATIFAVTPIPPVSSDIMIDQKPYRLIIVSQHVDRRHGKDVCETILTVTPLFSG